MHKKLTGLSILFASACCLFFLISMFFNNAYLEALTYDNAFSYQLRQLASILLLWGIGLCFLLLIQSALPMVWALLLAFPTGLCLWVLPGMLLLMLELPYTFSLTMALIAFFFLCLLLFRLRQKSGLSGRMQTALKRRSLSLRASLPALLLLFGFAFLASSGFLYVFLSYDSYFYFTNYGNTLAIVKNFRDIVGENSFTLTNISQFLPLLNAYTAFWGLDQCFQIQAFLTLNIAACFFYALYRYVLETEKDPGRFLLFPAWSIQKKALLYAALLTLFLITSTSFLTISSWILANMYCMAYLFLCMLLTERVLLPSQGEAPILAALYFAALTLLRKDGIIFVCFFLVCYMIKSEWKKRTLFFLFLPSVVLELSWLFYVRVILKAAVEQASFTSIANNANVAFVIAAICAACLYLFVFHPLFAEKLPFPETLPLYAGLSVLLILLTARDWNQVVDNIDMTIRNMLLYPSSWGISALLFGVLLTVTLLHRPFWDTDTFLWLGYVILNFISYCAVGKKLWVNWDDSYSRIVLQIVPVFVFICGKKLLSLLRSDTPDRNSVS